MTQANIVISAKDKTSAAFKSANANMKTMSGVASGLAGKIAALTGAAGAGSFVLLTKRAIEYGDHIAKTADKTGFMVETLQELVFAGDRTNVSASTMEMALQRFSRRLGEAADGGGVLKPVLDSLNISIRDSEGNLRSNEAVLNDYADAIASTSGSQQQLALAFKAFDSEGAALVNTLRNGSAGLNDLRQQARDAGAVMDESLTRKAEVINDRWDTMSTTIGIKFKSALISAADASLNFLKIYNDLESTLWAIVEAEERLLDSQDRLEKSHGRNRAAAKRANDQAEQDLKTLREQARIMQDAEERINRMKGASFTLPEGTLSGGDKTAAVAAKAQKRLQDQLTTRYETIRQGLLDEETLEAESYFNKLTLLDTYFEGKIGREAEHKTMLEDLEAQHMESLLKITQKGLTARQKFTAKSARLQTHAVLGELVNMTQGVAQSNKAMFALNKAAGIGEAIMNTYIGVSQALKAYPPPLSFAMAAAQAAAGFATVNAIRSQSFGGGGSAPSLAGVGGGSTTVNTVPAVSPIQQSQNEREQSVTQIHINGPVYGMDDFDDRVVESFKNAIDRDVVIIDSSSRQAQELQPA